MNNKNLVYLALLSLTAACGGGDAGETAADTTSSATAAAPAAEAAPAAPAAAGTVTDPQIAAIVVAANEADIKWARLALEKTQNPEVRGFAEAMVNDHGGVNQTAVELVTRLGVTPEPNPTSQQLSQGGDATHATLSGKSGADFDKAYIANEVAYHRTVLDAVDNTLIPNAQNAELKELLVSVRPAFVNHLQRAEQVQAAVGGQ